MCPAVSYPPTDGISLVPSKKSTNLQLGTHLFPWLDKFSKELKPAEALYSSSLLMCKSTVISATRISNTYTGRWGILIWASCRSWHSREGLMTILFYYTKCLICLWMLRKSNQVNFSTSPQLWSDSDIDQHAITKVAGRGLLHISGTDRAPGYLRMISNCQL